MEKRCRNKIIIIITHFLHDFLDLRHSSVKQKIYGMSLDIYNNNNNKKTQNNPLFFST